MKKLFLHLLTIVVAFVLATPSLRAHSISINELDSLIRVFDNTPDEKLTSTGQHIISLTQDESLFFSTLPQVNNSMTRDEQQLLVLFAAERWMNTNSYFQQALALTDRLLPLARKQGNNDIYATLLCDRTYCLYKQSDYAEAIETGKEAAHFSQQTDNTLQHSRAYLYISLVNYGLRNYDQAVQLVEKDIEINNQLGTNEQTHNTYGIACELYCGAGQLDKAVEYGQQATRAAEEIGNQAAIANHLTQLSYAYDRKGEYERGLNAANRAIDIVKSLSPLDRNQLAISLEFKAWNLIDLKRHTEAVDALKEAIRLEQELGNHQAVCYDYRTLYEALEPADPRGALAALKRYTVMADSLHSIQLKELTTKANAELRNDELLQQNIDNQHRQKLISIVATVVLIFLLAIIALLVFAFQQKRKTAKALQQLNQAREDFFTNVTHEFRTPLTVILGLGQQLQEGTFTEQEQQRAGALIQRQGNRLLTLVNQILDISKIKSSVNKEQQQEGDIAAYINMIIETYRQLAAQKNIDILFDAQPKHIYSVFIADYIDKVVGNLLSNAIKFTDEGGQINIRLSLMADTIHFTISDNGCGIPDDDQKHIFEPFYRAQNAGSDGSGIGLALVKQIIDAANGQITVKSQEGKGTTFAINIPQHKLKNKPMTTPVPELTDLSDQDLDQDLDTKHSADTDNLKPTILIVEDNEDVSTYIGNLLSNEFNLSFARNGQEGFTAATQLMPDLIITDLMMPLTDGLTLCRNIRQDSATDHIPIIVVTAKASEKDRIEGLKAGADAYLTKPFNIDELRITINNLRKQRERLKRIYTPQLDNITAPAPTDNKPDTQTTDPANQQAAAFMQRIDNIINQLDSDKLTAEELASEMCMSLRTLQRKMVAITGTTPKKYIMEARLKKACLMKEQNPALTLDEIATSCGFHDAPHFIHAFQNTFGESPKNYFATPDNKG